MRTEFFFISTSVLSTRNSALSPNHLIRSRQHIRRNRQTDLLRGLEMNSNFFGCSTICLQISSWCSAYEHLIAPLDRSFGLLHNGSILEEQIDGHLEYQENAGSAVPKNSGARKQRTSIYCPRGYSHP